MLAQILCKIIGKALVYRLIQKCCKKTNWTFEEVISPEQYSKYVKEWIENGINLVGACCGITTEHIRYISENNF